MINKNKLEFFLFKTALLVFKLLGLNKTRRAALLFGNFIYYFIPVRKKTTIENLRKAFPQKPDYEIKTLARKNYQNMCITFFELMCIPNIDRERMKEQVEFDNIELIQKKIDEKKGLIIFTGHFGNWEFVMTSISTYFNIQLSVLFKPQRNQYITDWLIKTREIFGAKVIALGVSVKALYKALVDKEIVGIAGDQRGHKDNPRFNFFNQPTALYTGTASIALRTKCNVLLVAAVRQKNFKYKCFTEELNFENLPEDVEAKERELTQRYISFIEKHAREHPEQYFWMHKIWKY